MLRDCSFQSRNRKITARHGCPPHNCFERPHINLTAICQIGEDGVMALFQDRLAKVKWPREVVFADELPRTALGKVQKGELRKRLG